jgi:hypothetical protein
VRGPHPTSSDLVHETYGVDSESEANNRIFAGVPVHFTLLIGLTSWVFVALFATHIHVSWVVVALFTTHIHVSWVVVALFTTHIHVSWVVVALFTTHIHVSWVVVALFTTHIHVSWVVVALFTTHIHVSWVFVALFTTHIHVCFNAGISTIKRCFQSLGRARDIQSRISTQWRK